MPFNTTNATSLIGIVKLEMTFSFNYKSCNSLCPETFFLNIIKPLNYYIYIIIHCFNIKRRNFKFKLKFHEYCNVLEQYMTAGNCFVILNRISLKRFILNCKQ